MIGSRAATMVAAGAALAWLSGCGGGGGTAAPGAATAPGTGSPSPAPTAGATTYQVHFIITMAGQTQLEVTPGNAAPVAPPGGSVGAAAAGAVVTYPNGSTQVADAAGAFVPSASAYAVGNAAAIQTNPVAQPHVKVAVPGGQSQPAATYVSAYGAASIAMSSLRRPAAQARFAEGSGALTNLAGVLVLPVATALSPGDVMTLQVEGTDVDDLPTSLQDATITWSSASGASITSIAGTGSAVYAAPAVTGSTPLTDTVTATVRVPGSNVAYAATSRVITIAPAAGFTVSGVLQTSGDTPLAGGTALFVQDDAPRIYPSFNWFANADASGNYSRTLPANTDFGVSLSPPASAAPGGAANFYPAVLPPGGESSYTTSAAGGSASVNLALGNGDAGFDDAHDDAAKAYPAPVTAVRDAWYATASAVHPYPFDADSGLQQILASVPPASTLPSPAQPTTVPTGLLAQWCYQWVALGGAPALVVVENAGAACGSPGNLAYVITPGSTPGAYAFAGYVLPSGSFPMASPLNPSPGAALLSVAGTWTQTPAPAGAAPSNDAASIQLGFYGQGSQVLGSPLYAESFQYTYTLGGGMAMVQLSNESLTDPATGRVLQRIALVSAQQVAQLNGASGCVGTPAPCYQATATGVTRTFAVGSGTQTRTYQLSAAYDGDGSERRVLSASGGGDQSKVVIPIAANAGRTAGSCIVCASSLGAFYDTDGQTQIGSFTITSAGIVRFSLLDTSEGGAPGNTVDMLTFML